MVLLSSSAKSRLIAVPLIQTTVQGDQLALTLGTVPQLLLTLGTPTQILLTLGSTVVGFNDLISIFKGEVVDIPLLFEDSPGNPHDLDGGVIEFVVKSSHNETAKVLDYVSPTNIIIDLPTTLGTATLKFLEGWAALVPAKSYRWNIYLRQGATRNPWGGGCFEVKPNTEPTI